MFDWAVNLGVIISLLGAIISVISTYIAIRAQRATESYIRSKEGPIETSKDIEEHPALTLPQDEVDDRA